MTSGWQLPVSLPFRYRLFILISQNQADRFHPNSYLIPFVRETPAERLVFFFPLWTGKGRDRDGSREVSKGDQRVMR
jgi:hypothetical protein